MQLMPPSWIAGVQLCELRLLSGTVMTRNEGQALQFGTQASNHKAKCPLVPFFVRKPILSVCFVLFCFGFGFFSGNRKWTGTVC